MDKEALNLSDDAAYNVHGHNVGSVSACLVDLRDEYAGIKRLPWEVRLAVLLVGIGISTGGLAVLIRVLGV